MNDILNKMKEQGKRIINELTRCKNNIHEIIDEDIKPHIQPFIQYFKDIQDNGYILYALTVTYTPYQELSITPAKRFHHLYWNKFLQKVYFKQKQWIKHNKHLQPILFFFEEHHALKSSDKNGTDSRVHHHVIMAVHPDFANNVDAVCGSNTLSHLCNGIMTTDLKRCDLRWVLYATKDYKVNGDFGFYGPVK